MDVRTDLALEVRESFPEDNIEIRGVILKQKKAGHSVNVSIVDIVDENGAKAMGKPVGRYVTIEMTDEAAVNIMSEQDEMAEEIKKQITKCMEEMCRDKKKLLVVCLGNRDATPDSLGPKVFDRLSATSHLIKAGILSSRNIKNVCAIEPGVMAKTGIETARIIKGIVDEIKPDAVIAVDALAARSIGRLNRTVQITNTGICPGAGIGNNRQELSKETLGVDVIAIGVPTVVEAFTIVRDYIHRTLVSINEEEDLDAFISMIKKENSVGDLYVTPKSIDEDMKKISIIISEALNGSFL